MFTETQETNWCKTHSIEYLATIITTTSSGRRHVQPCDQCVIEAQEETAAKEAAEITSQKQAEIGGRFSRAGIPPRYTTRDFTNFHAKTAEQENALKSVQLYADTISEKMKTGAGLILSGKPGTGKTHLACAVGSQFMLTGGAVLFITVSVLVRKVRETYSRESTLTEQQVINSLRDIDLLIIDEIGLQKGSESEEHLLFEIINERYSYYKPTILLSNLNADEIKQYIGTRSLDRMSEGGGKFVYFGWESYRGQVAGDDSLPDGDKAKYTHSNKPARAEL